MTPAEAEKLGDRIELRKSAVAGGPVLGEQKISACASAVTKLEEAGYAVTIRNGGLHLQFLSGQGPVDYWPTTGKFWLQKRKLRGTGFAKLLRILIPKGPQL